MNSFEFYSVPRIIFGRGTVTQLGAPAAEWGPSALVVTNAGTPGDGGTVDRLAQPLTAAGVRCCFWRQRGEPEVEHDEAGRAVGQRVQRRHGVLADRDARQQRRGRRGAQRGGHDGGASVDGEGRRAATHDQPHSATSFGRRTR